MASPLSSPSPSPTTSTSTSTGPTTVTIMTALTKRRSLVPARWKETVRVVGMAECKEAALTLAHAFAADDYARYLVVSAADDDDGTDEDEDKLGGGGGGGEGGRDLTAEEGKWRLHVDILTYTVASHCMGGLVTAVGPECDSVALWYVCLCLLALFCFRCQWGLAKTELHGN